MSYSRLWTIHQRVLTDIAIKTSLIMRLRKDKDEAILYEEAISPG